MINIKKWLIHKLGGYTELQRGLFTENLLIEKNIFKPIRLKVGMWFNNYTCIPEEEMIKYAKKELTSKIVEELLEKDLIKFDYNIGMEYNNLQGTYKHDQITAELMVYKKED